MAIEKTNQTRINQLADVAEMYYLEGKDQSAIAREIGVTRSMISRMLSEARSRGLVEIKINRPIQADTELEEALQQRFGIDTVMVVSARNPAPEKLLIELGRAAAEILQRHITAKMVLGLAWGTSISATIDAIEDNHPSSVKVVQMVGAMGARNVEYDGHALVQRMVDKLGGEGYFINAPYLCPSPEIAQSLIETQGIKEAFEMVKHIQVALLGIGTTEIKYSSYYLAGLLPQDEIKRLYSIGVVGDIASNYYMLDGTPYQDEFTQRLIAIKHEDLISIPVRIGVAGGPGKVGAIIGALRSQLINILVTDSITARSILDDRIKT